MPDKNTAQRSRRDQAIKLLGQERLTNFLRAAALHGADPTAVWKAERLSARTFNIQCGGGRTLRRWRTSFRACGKVQLLKAAI